MKRNYRTVVIAGCGRLGIHLAEHYSEEGADVVVLDPDAESFGRLSVGFSGFTVAGSAAEFRDLKRAGLEKADLFVAVTESDTLNIMCAEFARLHFGVRRVFARVYEPALEEFCASLGISAVSPVTAAASRFVEEIEAGVGAIGGAAL